MHCTDVSCLTASHCTATGSSTGTGSSTDTAGSIGKAVIGNLFRERKVCFLLPLLSLSSLSFTFPPLVSPVFPLPRSGQSIPDLGSAVSPLQYRKTTFAATRHISWALNT